MSIFSALGSIGKSVGKVALGAVGGVLGTATGGLTSGIVNANMFDSKSTAAVVVPVAAAPAVASSLSGGDTQNVAGGSILTAITNGINAFTDLALGRTHAQVDVHTTVGGTQDAYGNTSNGLPSWLLPAGLVAGAFFLFSGNKRRR